MKAKIIIAALATLLLASQSYAGIQSAVIQVDGLTCPFCAYGLEKKFKALPGVSGMKVRMRTGKVEVLFKENAIPTVESLRKAVVDGGFTPREIELSINGRLLNFEDQHGVHFAIEDTGVKFVLLPPEDKSKVELERIEKEWLRLRKEGRVIVTGRLHEHTDAVSKDIAQVIVVREIHRER